MDVELLEEFDPLPELFPLLDEDLEDEDFPAAAEARAANPDLLGSNFTLDELDLPESENEETVHWVRNSKLSVNRNVQVPVLTLL